MLKIIFRFSKNKSRENRSYFIYYFFEIFSLTTLLLALHFREKYLDSTNMSHYFGLIIRKTTWEFQRYSLILNKTS